MARSSTKTEVPMLGKFERPANTRVRRVPQQRLESDDVRVARNSLKVDLRKDVKGKPSCASLWGSSL